MMHCELGKLQTICLFRKPELDQASANTSRYNTRVVQHTLIKAYNVKELSRTHEYLKLTQERQATPPGLDWTHL